VVNSKMNRTEMSAYFSTLKRCLIAIAIDDEYAALARHWAKKLESYNHSVTLLAFEFVNSFAKRNGLKNVDAETICKALEQL
jgi:transposase